MNFAGEQLFKHLNSIIMKAIIYKIDSMLYRYTNLLAEIVAQKSMFNSEYEFIKAYCKYGSIVNNLQGKKLKYSI